MNGQLLTLAQTILRATQDIIFFAGIAGWERALQIARWHPDRPVCTASLPCQPFSLAGKERGKADERHLLPHFINLVKQCNFQTIFGEQVPAAIKHGWLDDLCTEMEREKYTVGSILLTAAGAGSPHIRQRLYWVADSSKQRQSGQRQMGQPINPTEAKDRQINRAFYVSNIGDNRESGGLGNTDYDVFDVCQITASDVQPCKAQQNGENLSRESSGASGRNDATSLSGCLDGRTEWDNPDWLYCRDGKYRPIRQGINPLARTVKSSSFEMANGLPRGVGYSSNPSEPIDANNTQEARVMRLKGYGNAIVPQVAAQFISAFLDCPFEDQPC